MPVGRFKGVPVDKLPLHYCRWILTQKFPKEIIDIVKAKVEASAVKGPNIDVTLHAIDKFSLIADEMWRNDGKRNNIGISAYLRGLAVSSMVLGTDISLNRHEEDSRRYLYRGLVFCIAWNDERPQYKELVTVYRANGG